MWSRPNVSLPRQFFIIVQLIVTYASAVPAVAAPLTVDHFAVPRPVRNERDSSVESTNLWLEIVAVTSKIGRSNEQIHVSAALIRMESLHFFPTKFAFVLCANAHFILSDY